MAVRHDPKAAPHGATPKDPKAGDKAPVAVAGPEAQKREHKAGFAPREGKTPDDDSDPAPVVVTGPEAQAREK